MSGVVYFLVLAGFAIITRLNKKRDKDKSVPRGGCLPLAAAGIPAICCPAAGRPDARNSRAAASRRLPGQGRARTGLLRSQICRRPLLRQHGLRLSSYLPMTRQAKAYHWSRPMTWTA